RRAIPRWAEGPPHRSTGSTAVPRGSHSSQLLLVNPEHPLGERLTLLAPGQVATGHAFDVLGKFLCGGLEAAQLAAESGGLSLGHAHPAAEVYLEALNLAAVRADHQLTLQPDVGGLGPGAGVRTTVDVDRDVGVEVGQPLL